MTGESRLVVVVCRIWELLIVNPNVDICIATIVGVIAINMSESLMSITIAQMIEPIKIRGERKLILKKLPIAFCILAISCVMRLLSEAVPNLSSSLCEKVLICSYILFLIS